jgi:hypothetical protein
LEHSKWQKEIPYIQFPADWQVQISPPFAGAVVRFRVKKDKAEVSIYLDCYDRLGCYGSPYWEVYPYKGDVGRCGIDEIDTLLSLISTSLEELEKGREE